MAPHSAPDRSSDQAGSTPALDALQPALDARLTSWLPSQRWFAHKGRAGATVRTVGWAELPADDGERVLDLAVRLEVGGALLAVYQVPVVVRRLEAADDAEDGARIAVLEGPEGRLAVDDALRTATGRRALALLLADDGSAAGEGLALECTRDAELSFAADVPTRILSGEQSNTSVIIEPPGATPVILKVFRVLADGDNPDVVLQGALTARGSAHVPAVLGSARVEADGMRAHALVAQEFLPGVEDAWRVALAEAVAGTAPEESMRALGETLAEVHRDLAAALGSSPADEQAVRSVVAQMLSRLEMVSAEVPQVAEHAEALRTVIATAGDVSWPALQRIHGDLHLGQVLRAERGWILLDFEGEPLRPLAERTLPDAPQRDVAGMLRSFDYVAGAVAREQGVDVGDWSERARRAFLTGYGPVEGVGAEEWARLLAAFEADKAVYEALYEARNRPDWIEIPLGALERISARAAGAASQG